MIEALAEGAIAAAIASLVIAAALGLRRLSLARREARRLLLERDLRPRVLALIEGEAERLDGLDPARLRVAAGMLARYSRRLSGEPRARMAAWFAVSGHVERELASLRSRRAWRRAGAAFALGDMGDRRAEDALLALVQHDRERDVRAAAARSLGRLRSAAAAGPIVEALVAERLPRGRGGQALLELGDAALPGLRALTGHEHAEVRATAFALIGRLGAAPDARLAAAGLRDPAAAVRAEAARALGRLAAAEHTVLLRDALGDRIPFVRAAAATALGSVGDRASVPALLEIARRDVDEPAAAAARAAALLEPAAVQGGDGLHLAEAADLLDAGIEVPA